MKFLLHGNAPTAKTGYGIQLAHLGRMLRDDGHEVAYSSTFGVQSSVTNWNGFRVYGCGFDYQSNDLIHQHAAHWFRNEPGWIIIHTDVWAMENPLHGFNTAAWVPIDHYLSTGCQLNVHQFFERTGAVPIAMSRFGEDMLRRRGHDPLFVPLSVDTTAFHPIDVLDTEVGEIPARLILDSENPIPDDAFVVGMVAMNKGWSKDRKGFNEAFHAFGLFNQEHPDANAHFYVHSENLGGMEGINLIELATVAGIPEHKIHWAGGKSQYPYRLGYSDEMMVAMYSAIDVLLAPSHGEGFCVPIIEANACGTPVIVSDFSAQRELVPDGVGWKVVGQPEWDPAQHAGFMQPYIADVLNKLEEAYEADRAAMRPACIGHAKQYDTQYVYETYWRPVIAELIAEPDKLELDRQPMPEQDAVAVLCPIYKRTENIPALIESFQKTTTPGYNATLYLVGDDTVVDKYGGNGIKTLPRTRGESCAQGWNAGFAQTTEPWVLCIGDDVRFHEGWLDEARKLSTDFDVIGTNDTAGEVKHHDVAKGTHADHFFVRRTYVDEYGASLDGPGILAPECYRHWWVDKEIVELAKARGVWSPCLDSVVEHLHEGFNGGLTLEQRLADPVLRVPVESAETDERTYLDERLPLIQQQRTTRAHV
jgi:glycosyltransferase involved in cell wall biosynthesis